MISMNDRQQSVSEIFHPYMTLDIGDGEWKARALAAEAKLQNQEMVVSYARDVISFWPRFTLRTANKMGGLIQGLKEAIEL